MTSNTKWTGDIADRQCNARSEKFQSRDSISGPQSRQQHAVRLAGLISLFSVLGVIAAPASAAPAVSSSLTQYGFPDWYEDNTGTRVEACLDPNDPHCVVLGTPGGYDPLLPTVFPTNFPDEFFYSIVEADNLPTPGCTGHANPLAASPGIAKVRFALEAAFANETPAFNEQMVFGRVRVTVTGGLCPGQQYSVVHPYGTFTFTAGEDGDVKPGAGTSDIGCLPIGTQTCNFAQALGSPLITTGLLRWDTGSDAGYLSADAATLHTITGGVADVNSVTFRDSTETAIPGMSTNQFTVSAKLAGPLLPSTQKLDFGGQPQGTTSSARTITLKNIWKLNNDVRNISITSVNPSSTEFAVTNNTCTALNLDESCTVELQFTPSTTGVRTANLVVTHDGPVRSPLNVALTGTGTANGEAPALRVSTPDGGVFPVPVGGTGPSLTFEATRIGIRAEAQPVTISNTGSAPLQVQGVSFADAGPNADSPDFQISSNTCAGVFLAPSETCTVQVAFQPLHNRAYTANLVINANTDPSTATVALTATGTGGVATVSTKVDPENGLDAITGFPSWYRDENGVTLGQCIDQNDPLCIVLADDFYDPGQPLIYPTNFPSEYFYFQADSDIVNTPGCGISPPGRAFVRMADEAAFSGPTGGPVPGDQMVFGRIRFSVTSGLCPNTTYKFTYPYGQQLITTDATGGIRRAAATSDVGCAPVAPEVCNWELALQSPVLASFIKQVNAPPGYLGDPALPAAITGAPYTPPGESTPANYFRIQQLDGTLIGETNQFTVMGKLLGPIVAVPSSLNFGAVQTGLTSDPQDITFRNDGIAPVTTAEGAATIAGTHAGAYSVDTGCDNQTLNPGQSCTVHVTFHPTATGEQVASVRLAHTGLNNPASAALKGLGSAPAGQPGISVNPPTLTFVDLHVGQTSASESLVVSNAGGRAPLIIGDVTVGGPPGAAANFTVDNECTAPVPVDGSCVINVAFTPSVSGPVTATIDIANNTTATPVFSVPTIGRGSFAVPTQSNVLTNSGFPTWYQDDNGVRVEPCLDTADSNCVVLGDATFDPGQPVVFPTNFPMEFFYSLVDSDPEMTIPSDEACGAGGTVLLRMALEGTFTSAAPATGAQTVFSRLRITGNGLCPNTTYNFVTPWGLVPLTTDGAGQVKAGATFDNDNELQSDPALQGGALSTGLLRWDPNDGAPAPAGYLGNAVTLHKIVGSRYRPTPTDDPVNYFEVQDTTGRKIVSTDMFTVSGKMAGPVVTDTASVELGSIQVGSQTPVKSVIVTNIGSDSITGFTPSLAGTDAAQFQVAPTSTCNDTTVLATDQTCKFDLVFAPGAATAVGPKTASLVITHGGPRSPVTVALSGTALSASVPHITVTPASLTFNGQALNTTSAAQTITVQNSGETGSTLHITGVDIVGAQAGDYVRGGTCSNTTELAAGTGPGSTCTVVVQFRPTAGGTRTATVNIVSDDPLRAPTGLSTVSLTGTGQSGVVALSATSLSFSTGAGGSTSSSVKLTNTGTANFSVVGAPALLFTDARFTGTHNCNNVAPGRNCNVTVTFRPPNGTRGQTFTGTLTILTNASNSSAGLPTGQFLVNLRGTSK